MTRSSRSPEVAAPAGLPRLLAGLDPAGSGTDLPRHLAQWGWPPRRRPADVLGEIERSGLRGRGGAWFPTAVKWRAVASRRMRSGVVVVNGAEAEPASGKDRLLLHRAPHLVLDGASLAAGAVGAARVIAYVPPALVDTVGAAVAERRALGIDPVGIDVVAAATSFVAGEESAVVDHLNGGPGSRPSFTAVRPVYQRGVGGRPTLVQNAETLAHAALVGRFGADWFRRMGTAGSPGSALLTVSSPSDRPSIIEVALGTPLRSVLAAAGVDQRDASAALVGGFGGTWLALPDALDMPLAEESLRGAGATLGAGVVAVLGQDGCPLAETAHVAAYLETQGAGQCGPCLNGLPALAGATAELAWRPTGQHRLPSRLEQLGAQIEGRGACHHPDGAVRLVRSALRAFPGHVRMHLEHGPCRAADAPPVLPVRDPRRAVRSA